MDVDRRWRKVHEARRAEGLARPLRAWAGPAFAAVLLVGGEPRAALAQSWWNCSYEYRCQLTVTTSSAAAAAGYPVSISFDHAALVSAGKAQSDGDDVRIAYWNGANWVERDRLADSGTSWNTASCQPFFPLAAALGANSSDSNYYLYYGNAAAAAPPADPSTLYHLYDDFSAASLDLAKWDVVTGSPTVSGGVLTVPSGASLASVSTWGTGTAWEARLALGGDGTEATFDYWSGTNNPLLGGLVGEYIRFYTNATTHYAANSLLGIVFENASSFAAATPTSYHVYRFMREGTTGIRFFQDATQVSWHTTAVSTSALYAYIFNNLTGDPESVDWVKVRSYVTPEPVVTRGAEELASTPGNCVPLALVKRAFLSDGTPLASGAVLPRGTKFLYLVYVNNPSRARADVSLADVLDPAFAYQAATLRLDNSMDDCALPACSAAEEQTLLATVQAQAAGTDAIDGDAVSITGGTIHVGDGAVGNSTLSIASQKVCALLFSVTMQ